MNITAWQEYMEETKKLEDYKETGDNTLVMDVAQESVQILKVTILRFYYSDSTRVAGRGQQMIGNSDSRKVLKISRILI